MSVAAIGGGSPAAGPQANRFAEMNSQEFIQIMLAELSNQDPFEPADSAAVLEQLSSLRNIESQIKLQDKLESLVLQNQIAIAGGMIGKTVLGLDVANDEVSGIVTAVRVQDGTAILELDSGKTLPLDRVTRIDDSGASPAA